MRVLDSSESWRISTSFPGGDLVDGQPPVCRFSKSVYSFGTAIIFPRSVMIQLSFGIIEMLQTLFLAEHGRFYDFSLDSHDGDFSRKVNNFQ